MDILQIIELLFYSALLHCIVICLISYKNFIFFNSLIHRKISTFHVISFHISSNHFETEETEFNF